MMKHVVDKPPRSLRWKVAAFVALVSSGCHGYVQETLPMAPGMVMRSGAGSRLIIMLKDGTELRLDSVRVMGDSMIAFGYEKPVVVRTSQVAAVSRNGLQLGLTIGAVLLTAAASALLVSSCTSGSGI